VVHTDDTGWRVGGEPAHLMVFEPEAATVSQIRPRHRHAEVQEAIPADDPGVMVTDRGRSDEAQAFDNVRQQTCLAPIQRSIRDMLETKTGRARDFGEGLKALRQEACTSGMRTIRACCQTFRPRPRCCRRRSRISCATAAS
jgi:transposase